MELEKATSFEVAFFVQIICWFILPPLFLAVIAEASQSTRYGTGSVAETAIRDLHTHCGNCWSPALTPAGALICSSDSCGGKALAHVLVWLVSLSNHKNCDSAQFSRQQ